MENISRYLRDAADPRFLANMRTTPLVLNGYRFDASKASQDMLFYIIGKIQQEAELGRTRAVVHITNEWNQKAIMEPVLKCLKEKGYEFEFVDNYILSISWAGGCRPPQPPARGAAATT